MIMVSFSWKMNVLPNKMKNNSVSSTMFLKLITKVVAFFLGHPVYELYEDFFFFFFFKDIDSYSAMTLSVLS